MQGPTDMACSASLPNLLPLTALVFMLALKKQSKTSRLRVSALAVPPPGWTSPRSSNATSSERPPMTPVAFGSRPCRFSRWLSCYCFSPSAMTTWNSPRCVCLYVCLFLFHKHVHTHTHCQPTSQHTLCKFGEGLQFVHPVGLQQWQGHGKSSENTG